MLIPSGLEGKVSLLSAKRLLQNSAKAFRLNTGQISAWGTAQLRVENKKKPQCQKNQTLWSSSGTVHLLNWKLSPHYQINPQCTSWSRERVLTPALPREVLGPGHSGLSSEHTAHTQLQSSLSLSLGHGEAFLFVSTAVSLGFDIYTKWNYILSYKTVLVSGLQKLCSYPFSKVLETRSEYFGSFSGLYIYFWH